jgi:hypothetical protein
MGNCPACFYDTTIHHNSNEDDGRREAAEAVTVAMETPDGKHLQCPVTPPEQLKGCLQSPKKKVRFADEVELISCAAAAEEEPIISNRIPSDKFCIKEGNQLSGTMKVRVVITKKQYTQLMSPTSTARQREQSDALIESMLAPLLSPKPHQNVQACRDRDPNLVHQPLASLQPFIY